MRPVDDSRNLEATEIVWPPGAHRAVEGTLLLLLGRSAGIHKAQHRLSETVRSKSVGIRTSAVNLDQRQHIASQISEGG